MLTQHCMLKLGAHIKTNFKQANLTNDDRCIPSGAIRGADVQGLGGGSRKGQAKYISV